MNLVYKYCDSRGLAILEGRSLRITPPDQFNDPFEFTPSFEGYIPRNELRRVVNAKSNFREVYLKEKQAGRFTGSFRDFKKVFRPAAKPILEAVRAQVPDVLEYARNFLLPEISKVVGVLCLSACPDNILMWSHYGHGHTGIVIGFDGDHSFFCNRAWFKKGHVLGESSSL